MENQPPDAAAFLESTPLVPLEIRPDGSVPYVGPQAEALLGLPRDVWHRGEVWDRCLMIDDRGTVAEARANSFQARARHELDYRLERADGGILWVTELLTFADDADGPVLRGFLWDITWRKRQELALWRAEERIRGLIRQAPDAMVLTDGNGRILNMNDQAEALFDYPLSDLAGSSLEHLLPERLRSRLGDLLVAFEGDHERRSLVDGESLAIQRADRCEIPVEMSLGLVSGPGEDRQILWAIRDLTVRRRLEAKRE